MVPLHWPIMGIPTLVRWYLYTDLYWEFLHWCRDLAVVDRIWWYNPLRHTITETHTGENMFAMCLIMRRIPNKVYCMPSDKGIMIWNIIGIPILVTRLDTIFVRHAGLLWSQQDFEWRWSVPLFKCLTVLEFSFILFDLCLLITFFNFIMNYVPIVTFWIFTYHKIWILSIMFCFIWSYWIIYFLACLEVSWRVVS